MNAGVIIGIIIACIVVLFILFAFVICCCTIQVEENHQVIVEKFGRYQKTLQPGIHFITPLIESTKQISLQNYEFFDQTYYLNKYKSYTSQIDNPGSYKQYTTSQIPLKQFAYAISNIQVFTADHISLKVSVLVIFSIQDVMKAAYQTNDIYSTILSLIQSDLNEAFAKLSFNDSIKCQIMLDQERYENYEQFGLKIHTIKLQLIKLNDYGLKLQQNLIQDRLRRAQLTLASAESERMKLISEGQKISLQNKAIADEVCMKKMADTENYIGQVQSQWEKIGVQAFGSQEAYFKWQQNEWERQALYGSNDEINRSKRDFIINLSQAQIQ